MKPAYHTYHPKLKKNISRFFLILLFGIFSGSGNLFAQVELKLDTTKIRIGEQITYTIYVHNKDTVKEVFFPKLILDSLKKVELVKAYDIDSVKNMLFRKYMLTSFDSGHYMIPKQSVLINDIKHQIDSVYIDVLNVPVDTTKQKLYPVKPIKDEPYTFDDFKPYLWWLLGVLLLIGIIWYLIKRSKRKTAPAVVKPRIPPFELAKKRLAELDSKHLLDSGRVKQYYVELTDIVRSFIEDELHIPALESTTDELMETITDFNSSSQLNIPKETLEKLQHLLKDADLVKFAKMKPLPNEIDVHRKEAEWIIEDLHPKSNTNEKDTDDAGQ